MELNAEKTTDGEWIAFDADMGRQAVVLLLATLPAREAAALLTGIRADERITYLRRLSALPVKPLPVAKAMDRLCSPGDFSCSLAEFQSAETMPKQLAGLLMELDHDEAQVLFDGIAAGAPELAERMKPYTFFFHYLVYMDDRQIESVLRQNGFDAALLHGADEAVQQKLLRNVSRRVAAGAMDDLAYLPDSEKDDAAKAARKKIIATILRLAQAGELTLPEVVHGPVVTQETLDELYPGEAAEMRNDLARIAARNTLTVSRILQQTHPRRLALAMLVGNADFNQFVKRSITGRTWLDLESEVFRIKDFPLLAAQQIVQDLLSVVENGKNGNISNSVIR